MAAMRWALGSSPRWRQALLRVGAPVPEHRFKQKRPFETLEPAMIETDALFDALERINERPTLYSRYTADALWTSPDISEMLLRFHLDGEVDVASRRTDFIEASVDWMVSTFRLGRGQAGHRPGLRPGALHQPPGSQRCAA